ncbi:hypothetical protein [uncultured Xanthomonas sp.]|uniref:hypothetical protein n=1 Tax=uncultured Xanthomonas sp. TaxID=152831 RepID=UPI0025E5ECF6|nr:hypothetical protein [uncultured Xanthomonas sp.]
MAGLLVESSTVMLLEPGVKSYSMPSGSVKANSKSMLCGRYLTFEPKMSPDERSVSDAECRWRTDDKDLQHTAHEHFPLAAALQHPRVTRILVRASIAISLTDDLWPD